jgi:L-cystine transport system substrate-binding protein
MKKNKTKLISILLVSAIVGLTGCGAAKNSSASTSATESTTTNASATTSEKETASEGTTTGSTTKSESAPKKLVVTGPSAFDTVSYYDESGKLTGFEVELLRAIDEYLTEYEFDFQPTNDFASIFLGIETNKTDIAYCQLEYNEERAQKYLFTKESYCNFPLRLVVLGDNNDINSLEDLKGKTLQVGTGANDAYIMEQYNAKNGNPINLYYAAPDATITDASLKNGTIDAYVGVERYVDINNKALGFTHKCVGDIIADTKCYFITNLNNTELSARIDEAVVALKADGTISKLSEQFFGGNYTE